MEPGLNLNGDCYQPIAEDAFFKKGITCLPVLGIISNLFYEIPLINHVFSPLSDKRKVELLHELNHYFVCDIIRDTLSLATLEYIDYQFTLSSSTKSTLYTVAIIINLFRFYGIHLNQTDIKILRENKESKAINEYLN